MNGSRRRALKYSAAASTALLLSACRPEPKGPAVGADGPFTDAALRLDLRHSMREGADAFELVRISTQPKWGGRIDRLNGAPDWGDYRLSLHDGRDETPLYRAGFDSPLGATSDPATTQLSLRVPMPRKPLRAVIGKRRVQNSFTTVWNGAADPAQTAAVGPTTSLKPRMEPLLVSGPAASKVDLVLMAEGYTQAEYGKFIADAMRVMGYLFSVQPFSLRMRDFNVYAVYVPSAQSGVADRHLNVQKESAFGTTYLSGASERTLAVMNTPAMHDAASATPYDFLLVVVNARRYGGSAYFGGPAVVAAGSAASKYLTVHEFAHAFAGLAEEYYIPTAEGPAYRGNIEPWNPNVTLAPGARKWKDASGAEPQAAAWNKADYDNRFADYVREYETLRAKGADETAIEELMASERARQSTLLRTAGNTRHVGLFEGAHGYSRGIHRAEVDCIMFSLQTDYFCSACSAAIHRMIDYHST
jgi:hypothetical protein